MFLFIDKVMQVKICLEPCRFFCEFVFVIWEGILHERKLYLVK